MKGILEYLCSHFETIKDVFIGLVTGVISGWIVYVYTKRQERKHQILQYWTEFLFAALKECDMYIPITELRHMSTIGGKGSKWDEAIYAILDDLHPENAEDKELNEREARISKNVLIALKELDAWAKKPTRKTKERKQ